MQPELVRDARILDENTALDHILDNMKQDLAEQFLTCNEDMLIDLRRRVDALNALRSEIKSQLVNILETVNA